MKTIMLTTVALAASLSLAGCGGGGGSDGGSPVAASPAPVQPPPAPPTLAPAQPPPAPPALAPAPQPEPPARSATDYFKHWNQCQSPRSGVSPLGAAYPDRQGTLDDEMRFVRGWLEENYLWYRELPATVLAADFTNPIDYFNALKTPLLTASGRPKDRYHFTYASDRYDEMTTRGVDIGYGVAWSRNTGPNLPRTWIATTVEPGSPAAAAGLRRGDMLAQVDGIDFVNAGAVAEVAAINAAVFPVNAGEAHRFVVNRAGAPVAVDMSSAKVTIVPVKNTKVIDTPTGKVGYLTFGNHNGVAELQLIDAFDTLKGVGVTDLVLDVRYNGGGLLYIASELAYMIAGPERTAGKVFERPIYNDKIAPREPYLFRSTAFGFTAPRPARAGQPLPTLSLGRVTLLTTPGTCSASESIINSLRGVDVEVNLVGGETCGKPYAFTPVPNCGTTYFAIEFKGANEKGFGDYADGFAPTCLAADDFSKEVGDPAEGMLATALAYRANGACPAPAAARARQPRFQLVRDPIQEISIYPPSR